MSKTEQEGKLLRPRLRAGRLLLKSVAQAEVARRVGVTRTSVSEWNEKLQDGGARGAEAPATGSTGWAGRQQWPMPQIWILSADRGRRRERYLAPDNISLRIWET